MKIHEWVTIIGITAVLGGCGGSPPPSPQTLPRSEARKPPAQIPPAPVVLPKVPEGKPLPPMAYEANGRRDPFRSPPTDVEPPVNAAPAKVLAPKVLAPVEVRGIVSTPAGHLAIVNDQIVKVGDLVAGDRVERITATEVVLRQTDGSPRSVTLADFREARPTSPKK